MYMDRHRFDASGDPLARLESPQRKQAVPAADIVRRMGISEGELVLDIGAGTGYFSVEMARAGAKVVALDVEGRMLSIVRDRSSSEGRSAVMPLLADASSPPIRPSSFRRVLLAFLYHEVDDRRALLERCRLLLAPGGRLTVVDFQKRETGFGPPVCDRLTPEEVIAEADGLFRPVYRHDAEAYYQLELEKERA